MYPTHALTLASSSLTIAQPQARDLMLKALMFFAALISSASISIALFVEGHEAQVKAA